MHPMTTRLRSRLHGLKPDNKSTVCPPRTKPAMPRPTDSDRVAPYLVRMCIISIDAFITAMLCRPADRASVGQAILPPWCVYTMYRTLANMSFEDFFDHAAEFFFVLLPVVNIIHVVGGSGVANKPGPFPPPRFCLFRRTPPSN